MKIYCFAGPNGSGKSTLVNNFIETNSLSNIPFINADLITKELFPMIEDYNERNLAGAKYATQLREKLIEQGQDFMFETVLSTPRNLDLLKKAKEKGYEITVIYAITNNSEINVKRVSKRVSHGGHDVPTEKIIERYDRCIKLLPEVLDVADIAILYDNSMDDFTQLVAKKTKNQQLLTFYDSNDFFEEKIINPYCIQFNINKINCGRLPKPNELNKEQEDEMT